MGVYVKDLTSTAVKSVSEIDALLQIRKRNRSVAMTNMNSKSSRSHSVFTVLIECSYDDEREEEHEKSQHIPYRDSKLTRIFQDSLGDNTNTVMCANVGPADYNYSETLTTLRYANLAENIENKPVIDEDPKDSA